MAFSAVAVLLLKRLGFLAPLEDEYVYHTTDATKLIGVSQTGMIFFGRPSLRQKLTFYKRSWMRWRYFISCSRRNLF